MRAAAAPVPSPSGREALRGEPSGAGSHRLRGASAVSQERPPAASALQSRGPGSSTHLAPATVRACVPSPSKSRRQPGLLVGRMTELQSALLLRRQLAGERRGAGPRSRTDEPLASSRPLRGWVVAGREGGKPAGRGRPATLLARLWTGLGAGTRPSLALGRAGRPGRLPPPPRHWGVAGEGRGSRPGRPSLRGGSRAQVRRMPGDLRDPGSLRAPRGCESEPCRGPGRGGAPNFWLGSAGSAELGQTTKATAGPAWVLARGTEGSAGSATLLRLPPPGTSSGCAASLGEGGRGR